VEKKLTYEQLEEIANKLNQQCKQLYADLQQAQGIIAGFNEVGMLLTILGKGEYFSQEFVDRCSKKIEDSVNAMLDKAEETQAS
jgi:DNA repair exonuclease SbcCD ATPase subunit